MNGPDQYRFISPEAPEGTPIYVGRLLWIDTQERDPPGIRYWEVKDLATGECRLVGEWCIGDELNAMEVLAWAASQSV